MNFAIVNECHDPGVTPELLTTVAAAIQNQIWHDYGPMWDAGMAGVRVISHESDATPNESLIVLLDNADQQGALGYHDLTPGGRPYARIFVATIKGNGGTLTEGSNSVSVCISHEVLESLGDPYCNSYSDNVDGTVQFAQELCDPVESSSYVINGVSVSNFVGPRWFDPQDASGPWDMLGVLKGPMTVAPDGYVISRKPGQPATSTFGEMYPQWRKEMKVAAGSRTRRRVRA